jgi:hypothetical protein
MQRIMIIISLITHMRKILIGKISLVSLEINKHALYASLKPPVGKNIKYDIYLVYILQGLQ